MKVGSLLYENTCSEWLHVVYCKYDRLLSWQTPPSATIVAKGKIRVKTKLYQYNKLLTFEVPITTAANGILNYFIFIFFSEKVRLDIPCTDNSQAISSLIFSENKKKKKKKQY